MKHVKSVLRRIPGFRQMSPSSMIIAATYYGVALFTFVKFWYWGLVMAAVPFLVFYLLDINIMGNRRLCVIVSAAAGLAVLLGTAGGLAAAGMGGADDTARFGKASPVASSAVSLSAVPSGVGLDFGVKQSVPAGLQAAATGASAAASAGPEQSRDAYVAARGSKVFHLPGCASARRINPENLIGLAHRDEAVAAGLSPCKRCKP